MRHVELTLERVRPTRLLVWGIHFFLAAALTASQIPKGYAPFALGCIASSGGRARGGAALAGSILGAAVFLDFTDALPHIAAGILIVTMVTACQDFPFASRPWFFPTTAAGMSISVGMIYVLQSLSPLRRLTPCLAAGALAGVSAWFLRPLLLPEAGQAFQNGILFLAAALLLVFSGSDVFSIGRMLLCVLLAYAAYERGAVAGAAAGLGLGLAVDLCTGSGGGLFTAAYGLAGLATGSRMKCQRALAALAFAAAAFLSLLPSQEALLQPLLAECAAGALLFLLLPERFFGGKRVRRAEEPPPAAVAAAGEKLKERLNRAAGALRDLYDSMGRYAPAPADENPAIVFDRAAEKVCRGCALCELCWQKEYSSTFNAMNDATPYLVERGRALAKDFPAYFSCRCIHLSDFITAINAELSAFLLRKQYRRQLEETRRSAKGQYAQLSELLTATAAGLGSTAVAAMGEECRIGAALRPKEGETVCGDTVESFRLETGRWCLLLADGMGSGEEARRESALTCRLLRQFLEAGIEPEAALKTLNSAMALRGAETGSFTTIDLCACDSATGSAAFYKFGAAPSYLKKGGSVRRITGGTLPVGLRDAPSMPDVTHVSIDMGGFAVMVSDGVADPSRDDWLQDLLAGWEGEDPQTLAGLILKESIRREKLQDDCGILVLYRPVASGVKKV